MMKISYSKIAQKSRFLVRYIQKNRRITSVFCSEGGIRTHDQLVTRNISCFQRQPKRFIVPTICQESVDYIFTLAKSRLLEKRWGARRFPFDKLRARPCVGLYPTFAKRYSHYRIVSEPSLLISVEI